jgi:Fe-S-cluster containining protein
VNGKGSDKPSTVDVGGFTSERDRRVLTKHRLKYIPELRLSERLLNLRFCAGCSTSNCRAECCSGGASVDIAERDRILEQSELVRAHMDPSQEHATERWFEGWSEDRDFPSGCATTTRTHSERCVFLNAAGRCVLQAAEGALGDGTTLKPFYCRAFPICIDHGVLSYDDQHGLKSPCCGPVLDGSLSIFDVCAFELEHVLGPEGATELRELAGKRPAR